ncbi:NAD(P)/FAD-dependent oxidoreductase [Leucobacter tardus]
MIGGGAAGLSAAQALGRSLRRTLVIDGGSPRNRFAAHLHNAVGIDGTPPLELVARGRAEAEAYGVEFARGHVVSVRDAEQRPAAAPRLVVEVRGASADDEGAVEVHVTRAVVVATGITDELPTVPGLAERWGRTVLHCPYCHGWEVRGRRIAVLATSPLSMHHAKLLRQWTDDLLVCSADLGPLDDATAAALAARNVRLDPSRVLEVSGHADSTGDADDLDAPMRLRTEGGHEHAVDAVFTMGAAVPHDAFLEGLNLDRADTPVGSFIAVDAMGATSHPRIWAAGNVTNPMASVPIVAGAGTMAGAAVNAILVEEDFARAVADRPAAASRTDTPAHAHTPANSVREPRAGESPADFWERRYADAPAIWSGRVNASLAQVVQNFTPGRSLDLGCGEGGDVIWLAENGWGATGIDLSSTAVERAKKTAEDRVPGRAGFVAADLGAWAADPSTIDGSEAPFDLVTASFLQSPVEFPRGEVLRAAASRVGVDGHLVLIAHAAAPAWSEGRHGPGDFPSPEGELATLDLDPNRWRVITAEVRTREAVGPDGQASTLDDTVVVAQRVA